MKKDETLIRSNPEDEKGSIKNDTEKPTSFHVDKAEDLPKLEIPDLPPDATSLSPEELANVPVLTESVAVDRKSVV